jgi:hypothetical protein
MVLVLDVIQCVVLTVKHNYVNQPLECALVDVSLDLPETDVQKVCVIDNMLFHEYFFVSIFQQLSAVL